MQITVSLQKYQFLAFFGFVIFALIKTVLCKIEYFVNTDSRGRHTVPDNLTGRFFPVLNIPVGRRIKAYNKVQA